MTKEVYLEDGSILPWERPVKRRVIFNPGFNGSTKLIQQIGLDEVNEVVGNFRVIGSAVKYLADIAHIDWKDPLMKEIGRVTRPVRREVLFSGGLVIYHEGKIPGTDIQGYDIRRRGKIWIATPNNPEYSQKEGLRNLVLGNEANPLLRIEAILAGYQAQEDSRLKAQEEPDFRL